MAPKNHLAPQPRGEEPPRTANPMAPANGHSSSCGLPPAAGFGLACRRASAAGDGLHRRAAWARRSSTRLAWTSKAPRRLAPTAGFGAVDVSSASEALFGGLASSLRCFIPTKEAEKSKHSSSSFRRGLSVVLASGPQNLGQGGGLLGQRCACV